MPYTDLKLRAEWYAANCGRLKQYRKEYYAAHKAETSARSKSWRELNADRKAELDRQWKKANPGKVKAYSAKRYANNKEKVKAINDRWLAKNRNRRKAYKAAHLQENLDRHRINMHNRRARLKSNGGRLSPTIIDTLFIEQGGKCSGCFADLTDTGHHLDYVMPIIRGGANDDGNVQLLCPTCNMRKGQKHPAEFFAITGRLTFAPTAGSPTR